jgi:hypothetical protein
MAATIRALRKTRGAGLSMETAPVYDWAAMLCA